MLRERLGGLFLGVSVGTAAVLWGHELAGDLGHSASTGLLVLSSVLLGLSAGAGLEALATVRLASSIRDATRARWGSLVLALLAVSLGVEWASPWTEALARSAPGHSVGSAALRLTGCTLLLAPGTTALGFWGSVRVRTGAAGAASVVGTGIGLLVSSHALLPEVGRSSLHWLAAGSLLATGLLRLPSHPRSGHAPSPHPSLLLVSILALATGGVMAVSARWFRLPLGLPTPFGALATVATLALLGAGAAELVPAPHRRRATPLLAALAALGCGLLVGDLQLGVWRLIGQRAGSGLALACTLGAAGATVRLATGRDPERLAAVASVLSAGALGGGLLCLPLLGSRLAFLLAGLLFAAAAAAGDGGIRWRRATLLSGLLGLVAAVTQDTPPFPVGTPLLALQEGVESTAVVTGPGRSRTNRVLTIDGVVHSAKPPTGRVSVALSLAREPERVVLLGQGTGLLATKILRTWDDVDLDSVDRAPPTAAAFFGTQWLQDNDRFHPAEAEERHHLVGRTGRYDVILVDSTGPTEDPGLYTQEFFAAAVAHLEPGGVLSVPLVGLADETELAAVLAAAVGVLPHAAFLPPSRTLPPTLLGTLHPLRAPTLAGLPPRLAEEAKRAAAAMRTLEAPSLTLLPTAQPHSDRHPHRFPAAPDGALDAAFERLADHLPLALTESHP